MSKSRTICYHQRRHCILLCEWVIELCSVYLIDGVSCHNAFAFHLDSISLGIGALLCSSVVCYVLANINVNNVSVTLCFSLQRSCKVRNLFYPYTPKMFCSDLDTVNIWIYSTNNDRFFEIQYVQNNKIKKLTSKNLLTYFRLMALLFLFLVHEFFKTWNYIADSKTHVCLCIQAISRFRLNWQEC